MNGNKMSSCVEIGLIEIISFNSSNTSWCAVSSTARQKIVKNEKRDRERGGICV